MFTRLRTVLQKSKEVPQVFDENKLTDEEWVAWKLRCAKHMEIKITEPYEVILASRHKQPVTTEGVSFKKESM